MTENLLLTLIALGLVALNGFFVASEFSIVKLRSTRVGAIAGAHGLPGRILAKVHADLDAYLSACQLGITLSSLGLGWIGEPAFARLIDPLLTSLGVSSPETVHGISFFFAFITISYLHIVLGELVPKSMAIRISERVALWTAIPLYSFYWFMYPFIWMLNASANAILRRIGLGEIKGHDSHYSADELKLILLHGKGDGGFSREEWSTIAHMIDFGELEVSELMRPFHEAVPLYAANSLQDNLDIISRHRFSRYPMLDADGRVMGVVHVKDLFVAQQERRAIDSLDAYLRPVQLVAPTTPAVELFRSFRKGSPHFAIIGHKGAVPLGFITLDNMLAALVGEIRDEFPQSGRDWSRMDDGSYLGAGSLPIFTLERVLGVTIDTGGESENIGSIGGLVMWKLDSVPAPGDRVDFDGFTIVVEEMKGPRIARVRVYPAGLD